MVDEAWCLCRLWCKMTKWEVERGRWQRLADIRFPLLLRWDRHRLRDRRRQRERDAHTLERDWELKEGWVLFCVEAANCLIEERAVDCIKGSRHYLDALFVHSVDSVGFIAMHLICDLEWWREHLCLFLSVVSCQFCGQGLVPFIHIYIRVSSSA